MEIILLENIGNLGSLGEQVTVKSGYGRNFLLPKGKAVPATKDNIDKFEARRAELESAAATTLEIAHKRAKALDSLKQVKIIAKAGDEGKLFGSIGTRDIADIITEKGVELSKSEVRLPQGTIRETGEYEIMVQLHGEVSTTITVVIIAK